MPCSNSVLTVFYSRRFGSNIYIKNCNVVEVRSFVYVLLYFGACYNGAHNAPGLPAYTEENVVNVDRVSVSNVKTDRILLEFRCVFYVFIGCQS